MSTRPPPAGRSALPPLLLAPAALFFFSDLVRHPTQVLYSDYSDILAEHLPAKRFLVRSWQETGELPLWCPYRFGGGPVVPHIQGGGLQPAPLAALPAPRTVDRRRPELAPCGPRHRRRPVHVCLRPGPGAE